LVDRGRLRSHDAVVNGEAAALWWGQLKQWEQDDVQAWWHDRHLPFPLSAGLKQARAGLAPSGDHSTEMTDEALTFLLARFST
jgi:hypothetical protein